MMARYWNYLPFTAQEEAARHDARAQILLEAIDEEPGDYNDSKPRVYPRETTVCGASIDTRRPTWLNKGVDFKYRVRNLPGRNSDWEPKLQEVFDDVGAKIDQEPSWAHDLFDAIDAVFRMVEPDDVLADSRFNRLAAYKAGVPLEVLLKLLKWVFLEQDLTYWQYTGRRKPMDGIRDQFERRALTLAP